MSKRDQEYEIEENKTEEDTDEKMDLFPVLPLRGLVILPNMAVPVLVGREASIEAVEQAVKDRDKRILCVLQRDNNDEERDAESNELFRLGTVCKIVKKIKLPDGNLRILVSGLHRGYVKFFVNEEEGYLSALTYENFMTLGVRSNSKEFRALRRTMIYKMMEYVSLNKNIPREILVGLQDDPDPEDAVYLILANMNIDSLSKQRLYATLDLKESVRKITEQLIEENELIRFENSLEEKVKSRLNKVQKEYFLQEQLKIIHKELGISGDDKGDIAKFKNRIQDTNLSKEASDKAIEELKKLSRLSPHSQEYGVVHSYLNWILDLPWKEEEKAKIDIFKAQEILDKDHYGLKKVKERIVEYLSVMQLTNKVRGQILCLVGPPGVGKTSLGKSIAEASNREFVRLSLGGVRDEAEIRGHRRTYVGSMPGVIMQSMKKAGVKNPLIMMDEIDKMSMDFRGDPASALLEVLDPEQNAGFRDHYLDVEYDLSNVLFITTANYIDAIPEPLLDRMEIIELPGYTEMEKKEIATRHLIPRIINDHEVEKHVKIKFKDSTVQKIIQAYTREAGVRELDRKLAKIVRKVIKKHLEGTIKRSTTVIPKQLKNYLGVEKHLYSEVNKKDKIGVVTGLAWTMSGGDTLQIEVLNLKGEGKVKLTGQLGDVMQESAQAAYSLARKFAKKYGYSADFYKTQDLHLHIPEGAIPKDGPSAGITMTTVLISALAKKKIPHDLAMTGEVTLTGQVLAIGGLPEKLIAAKRAGITNIIVPKLNEPHLSEVADEIKEGLNIMKVSKIEEVLKYVFGI